MKFSHGFRVPPDDIDALGHVNNVSYLRWIQDVAVAHWLAAAAAEHIEKYSWVVVRHEIDYKRPSFLNEDITVATWVGEWTHVTCDRYTEIFRGEELLVSAKTVWCMIDKVSTRPAKIRTEVRDNFI